MSFDITKKRALETAEIELVNGDGSTMTDDDGNVLSVTVHGPGSKQWQRADTERSRRRTQRIQKNRNRLSDVLAESKEDEIDFLCAVTISFNGWEYPEPEGKKWKIQEDMFRACYMDDSLGFIRDHIHQEANQWSVFTRGSVKS